MGTVTSFSLSKKVIENGKIHEVKKLKLIEELVDLYLSQSDELSFVLDRETGEIILDASESFTGEPEIDWDDEEATGNYIEIPQITSREGFDLMVGFAKGQASDVSAQLFNILDKRKPFRNFKDTVYMLGLKESWYSYENDYATKKIIQWLEENDVQLSQK